MQKLSDYIDGFDGSHEFGYTSLSVRLLSLETLFHLVLDIVSDGLDILVFEIYLLDVVLYDFGFDPELLAHSLSHAFQLLLHSRIVEQDIFQLQRVYTPLYLLFHHVPHHVYCLKYVVKLLLIFDHYLYQ